MNLATGLRGAPLRPFNRVEAPIVRIDGKVPRKPALYQRLRYVEAVDGDAREDAPVSIAAPDTHFDLPLENLPRQHIPCFNTISLSQFGGIDSLDTDPLDSPVRLSDRQCVAVMDGDHHRMPSLGCASSSLCRRRQYRQACDERSCDQKRLTIETLTGDHPS